MRPFLTGADRGDEGWLQLWSGRCPHWPTHSYRLSVLNAGWSAWLGLQHKSLTCTCVHPIKRISGNSSNKGSWCLFLRTNWRYTWWRGREGSGIRNVGPSGGGVQWMEGGMQTVRFPVDPSYWELGTVVPWMRPGGTYVTQIILWPDDLSKIIQSARRDPTLRSPPMRFPRARDWSTLQAEQPHCAFARPKFSKSQSSNLFNV